MTRFSRRSWGIPVLAVSVASLLALGCESTGGRDESVGTRRDLFWTEQNLHSKTAEELAIRDFFQDRREGFFVDVGCSHAKKGNNTFYLESELGWSGVGVDALAVFAGSWTKLRPKSRFLNVYVSDRSGATQPFFRTAIAGLSTADRALAEKRTLVEELEVPTQTLDDLLAEIAPPALDLLSIDIGGPNDALLDGFDLQRWRPALVVINDDGMTAVPWFHARGYAPITRYRERDISNWYFAPSADAEKADAFVSAVGVREMEARRAQLAGQPHDSPVRIFLSPRVVIGPAGQPIPNPDLQPPR